VEKCRIFAAGCKKRNRFEEAALYENIIARYDTPQHPLPEHTNKT
jgi:hypothetical protein